MGRDIRNFIANQGGTMPEKLPIPNKSLKEIEKENKSKLIDNGIDDMIFDTTYTLNS